MKPLSAIVAVVACAVLYGADASSRLYVTAAAARLVEENLAAAAPAGDEAAAFQEVTAPGVGARRGQAQATEAPWLDLNGWRYERGLRKAHYARLPAGSAPLAAAEAFAYGVDAILNPDPADVDELGQMLRFLKAQEQPQMPALANVAIVDDGSPLLGEVLNLLTRRNLLYRVVSAPEPGLVTVSLGSSDFPRETARNPSDFAARVREKIGDDNRLVRVYGTSTVIARLTGDKERSRLFLLAYSSNRRRAGRSQLQQHVRIRLLGHHEPVAWAGYGAPSDSRLMDVALVGNATEFTLPPFSTVAIVETRRR
jgi:hypothetical protein